MSVGTGDEMTMGERTNVRKLSYYMPLAKGECEGCDRPILYNLAVGFVEHEEPNPECPRLDVKVERTPEQQARVAALATESEEAKVSTLDEQIREHLHQYEMDATGFDPTGTLTAAIRDVLDVIEDEDPPPLVRFLAESIRVAVASRLGILNSSGVAAAMDLVASTLGVTQEAKRP